MASFSENIFGSPGKITQASRFSQPQNALQNQLISQVSGSLANQGKNRFDFGPVAAEARNRFNTETIPSIAERFTAMGSGGSQRGSAFQGALGSAGAGLERGLASLQSQYGLQQQALDNNQLSALLGMAFQSPHENIYQEGQGGFLHGLSGGAGYGAGQSIPDILQGLAPIIGSAFGPVGSAAGAGASGLIALLRRLFGSQGQGVDNSRISVNPENTPGAQL